MDGAGNRALVPSARVWDSGGPPPPPPPPPSDPHFPAGLRVLVVDDDITCLTILKKMLVKCQYHVMVCSEAKKALNILRERKGCFDIVLSDVHMPDMDGFKLLEQIGLEMDLPVIMMSADDGKDIVMKGVTHGACDYLIKPVSMDSLRNIWQHVVRKKRHELRELENSCSAEESDKQKRSFDDGENDSSPNNGMWNNPKKRKEEEDEVEEREETSTMKKPRVVWSVELHQQFVTAVNQLGVDKAVPKKILELMNVPGLTRENVASHLQKYRLYLRRLSVPQNQVRVETPFPGATDPAFGSIIDGFEPPSQLHPQDHMSLHSAPRRSTNTFADMSSIDHMASFNPDAQMVNSTKMRPAPGQQLNQQMDMLYGPSMCVDPRQFVQSHQMIQFYGNMGVQVSEGMLGFPSVPSSLRANSLSPGTTPSGLVSNSLVIPRTEQGQHFSLSQQQNQMQNGMLRHPPLRGPPINGNVGELTSRISSTRQHNMHNGISSHVPGRGKYTADGDILLVGTYMNTSCIPSALPASSYSIMNSSVASILPSSDMTQESASTNMKGLKDFTPHYDLYNEARYDPAQQLGAKQRNIDFGSSFSTQQDFSSSLKDGGSRSTCTVRKEIFSIRAEIEREKVQCVSQQNGTFLMENSVRLKTESLPDTSGRDILYADNDFADDIIGVIGRQQQGTGQVEDYPFNVYTTR